VIGTVAEELRPSIDGWYAVVRYGQTTGYIKPGYVGTSDNPGDQYLGGLRRWDLPEIEAANIIRTRAGLPLYVEDPTALANYLSEVNWTAVSGIPAPAAPAGGYGGVTATPVEFYAPVVVPTVPFVPPTVDTIAPRPPAPAFTPELPTPVLGNVAPGAVGSPFLPPVSDVLTSLLGGGSPNGVVTGNLSAGTQRPLVWLGLAAALLYVVSRGR
jgi:hypothetical protein